MGIKKLTFNGENNTAEQASKIHLTLQSSPCGILQGIGNECAYTFANNTVTFKDGYVSIYGRIIEIENNTTIQLEPDGNYYGYVILKIDIDNELVTLELKEEASVPSLIKADISLGTGIYELPLVKYQKTISNVYILNNTENLIVKNIENVKADLIDYLTEEIADSMNEVNTQFVPLKLQSGKDFFYEINLADYPVTIFGLIINKNVDKIFYNGITTSGSSTGFNYRYIGVDYYAPVTSVNGELKITLAVDSHSISGLWIIR